MGANGCMQKEEEAQRKHAEAQGATLTAIRRALTIIFKRQTPK